MKFQIADLHNDAITELSSKKLKHYIIKAQNTGVETILISIWTTKMYDSLNEIAKCQRILANMQTSVKLLLHVEDLWFVNEDNIDELLKYKPFSVGLTWNNKNSLAGGALAEETLTPLGKILIKRLVKAGIHIDLAHLNKKSFWQVIALLQKIDPHVRFLCTHTCFEEITTHPRNLDTKQVQAIVNSGGLVGLTLVGEFLSKKKQVTFLDVYKHIKWFITYFGDKNLAIGSDFYGTKNLPKRLKNYGHFKHLRKFLLRKGLSSQTIDNIFYLNVQKYTSYHILKYDV